MKITFDVNCTDEFGRHQYTSFEKDPTIEMIKQILYMKLVVELNAKQKSFIEKAIDDAFELGKSVGGREVLLSLKEEIK